MICLILQVPSMAELNHIVHRGSRGLLQDMQPMEMADQKCLLSHSGSLRGGRGVKEREERTRMAHQSDLTIGSRHTKPAATLQI